MRYTSSLTSVSWIPSEAIRGISKPLFQIGFTHYDEPPPDRIGQPGDLDAWAAADRFRFANRLEVWVEVADGKIVDAGYGADEASGGTMGSTTIRLGGADATFAAVGLPDIRMPIVNDGRTATFTQTAGGRTAVPAPRHVNRAPFVLFQPPAVWTTLSIAIDAEGHTSFDVAGASLFPRHWVYDADGELVAKAGLTDFNNWYHGQVERNTPWGDEDTPALMTAVESALERELSTTIMRSGSKPKIRKIKLGQALTTQGAEGDELYLLLDGVLAVDVDGEVVAEVGPGAILGERALLEGGTRTSTLRALTPVRVAVARRDQIDAAAMAELSTGHRREAESAS